MSQNNMSFSKEISFYLLNYYNMYDLDKLSKFIMLTNDNDLNELFRINDLCDIIISSIEKKVFKSSIDVKVDNLSFNDDLINQMTDFMMGLYMCEELIYNDIIATILKYIVPSVRSYVSAHKDENKMKLFNKLPIEVKCFEDIIPYLGLCSYNVNNGVFVPNNEIKEMYKLSKGV